MARYIRRTGPAVDFPLPVAFTDIPQLTYTGTFDEGDTLILAGVFINNFAATPRAPRILLTLDGIAVPFSPTEVDIPGVQARKIIIALPVAIPAGQHTFTLQGQQNIDATQTASAGNSYFSVLQLPDFGPVGDFL